MRLAKVVSATTIIAISGPTMVQAEVCDPRYIPACITVANGVFDMTGDIFLA